MAINTERDDMENDRHPRMEAILADIACYDRRALATYAAQGIAT